MCWVTNLAEAYGATRNMVEDIGSGGYHPDAIARWATELAATSRHGRLPFESLDQVADFITPEQVALLEGLPIDKVSAYFCFGSREAPGHVLLWTGTAAESVRIMRDGTCVIWASIHGIQTGSERDQHMDVTALALWASAQEPQN